MSGGWFVNGAAPVEVPMGPCLCPGSPHGGGDVVRLRAELDAGGGFAVTVALQGDADGLAERLGRAYLQAGVLDWTFLDGDGRPVPVSPAAVAGLRWSAAVYELADRAAGLYGSQVMDPLVAAASASSQPGPTATPTSPTRRGSARPPRP